MIRAFPSGFFIFEEMQQLLAANLVACGLHEEGAPSAGADKGVDFPDQVFRQQNMGALGRHMCLLYVLY